MDNHKILRYSYWLSIACLIHCISFPLFIALLPLLDIVFEINEWFEIAIILSVIVFGSYSLFHAYKNHHQNKRPLIIFFLGITMSIYIHFVTNAMTEGFHLFMEIFSGIVIAGAQFYNLKITPKSCNHSHEHTHEKIEGIKKL